MVSQSCLYTLDARLNAALLSQTAPRPSSSENYTCIQIQRVGIYPRQQMLASLKSRANARASPLACNGQSGYKSAGKILLNVTWKAAKNQETG